MPPPQTVNGGSVQQGLSAAYDIFAFCLHRPAADKRYSLNFLETAMRILLTSLFCLCVFAFNGSAKAVPPESWFLRDDVLSQMRAEEIIDMTREFFWTNAKLPDGQPIKPKDEAERAATPIERMDALYFAQAAQLAGLAEWCSLDPLCAGHLHVKPCKCGRQSWLWRSLDRAAGMQRPLQL